MISHIHPITKEKQPLIEHLEHTSQIAGNLGERFHIRYLSKLAGYTHDFGKGRERFAEYLRKAAEDPSSVVRGSVNHSSAGAVYVYQHYYKDEYKLTAQLIAEAVLSHHGLNDCLTPDGRDLFHKRVEQLEDLDYDEVIHNLHSEGLRESTLNSWFDEAVKEVEAWTKRVKAAGVSLAYSKFMLERTLLSVLIDADRLDTAIFCGDRPKEDKSLERSASFWELLGGRLEKHLEHFQTSKENEIQKSRAFVSKQCQKAAELPCGIYKLMVPTGGGKTLAGLRYALNHAKQYKKNRIFYIAPYLSILEQNAQVFREVLKCDDFILEHHSNVITENQENEKKTEYDRYKHLTENWESPIVLTSFVQFLNTLFSHSTQAIRRFHSLADSILILDEIQSLPIEMISLFNLSMNYLSKICRTTVILCTATQPVLDQVDYPISLAEPASLIGNETELYQKMQRVQVEYVNQKMGKEELADFALCCMEEEQALLIIMNTKSTARRVFEELKDKCGDRDEQIKIIHLSANMCPQHRLELLSEIKNRRKEEKLICVSTNLIEAGVDISFPCVIRALAGLPSVAQAAGRCNRNGEASGMGKVYLIEYAEEYLGSLKQLAVAQKCTRPIVDAYERDPGILGGDLLSPAAIDLFYRRYYYDEKQKRLMNYPMDKQNTNMLELLTVNPAGARAYREEHKAKKGPDLKLKQAFQTAGKYFRVIGSDTVGVLVPYGEGAKLIAKLNGVVSQDKAARIRKKCQRYMVNLYRNQLDLLSGGLYEVAAGGVLALKEAFYDKELGVVSEGKMELLEV